MKNKELFQRVKDYMIVSSYMDGKVTELNLIKDLVNEIDMLEARNEELSSRQIIYSWINTLDKRVCNTVLEGSYEHAAMEKIMEESKIEHGSKSTFRKRYKTK